MNDSTENGGGDPEAGCAENDLRGPSTVGNMHEVADGLIVEALVSCSRACGAASRGFVQWGAGPLSCTGGSVPLRSGLWQDRRRLSSRREELGRRSDGGLGWRCGR